MSSKKTFLLIAITLVVIIAVFGAIRMSSQDSDKDTGLDQQQTQSGETNSTGTGLFTSEQVAEHNSKTDCWTIINDNVYDITTYISRHPGGDEILRACGTDGTSLFTKRETSTGEKVGSGTSHSSTAASALENLKVGTAQQ